MIRLSRARSEGVITVILGGGFTGRRVARLLREAGRPVLVTTRDPSALADLAALGADVRRVEVDEPETLQRLSRIVPPGCRVLHSVPAIRRGDAMEDPTPALLAAFDRRPARVVYLSTTGVYGDRGGDWVDEASPLEPSTSRGQARLEAEAGWFGMREAFGLPVHVFRLAGIYGPGRNQIESLRNGTAKRIVKPGQVFSRIHVEDIAGILRASMAHPNPGSAYNVCDDEPAPLSNMEQ